jgi:hypothetical protein
VGFGFSHFTEQNVEKVWQVVCEGRWHINNAGCNILGLSYHTCWSTLTEDMETRQIAVKFMPHLLNADQKQNQCSVCKNLQDQGKKERNFLSKVTIGNESWVYGYDSEMKQQSSQWKSP